MSIKPVNQKGVLENTSKLPNSHNDKIVKKTSSEELPPQRFSSIPEAINDIRKMYEDQQRPEINLFKDFSNCPYATAFQNIVH